MTFTFSCTSCVYTGYLPSYSILTLDSLKIRHPRSPASGESNDHIDLRVENGVNCTVPTEPKISASHTDTLSLAELIANTAQKPLYTR